MLIRANTLARGYSGIRLQTLETVLEFLNRGIHPIIPEKGSLGAKWRFSSFGTFYACVFNRRRRSWNSRQKFYRAKML